MIRPFFFSVLVLLSLAVSHANESAPVPDRVATLKSAYEGAKARAIAPLNAKYGEALLNLKSDYTKSGNLEDALAADALLKEVNAAGTAGQDLSALQDTGNLPERVLTLKSTYKSAVAKAIEPLNRTFAGELAKLKTDYTKAGNLEAAVAVDGLLQALAAPGASPTSSAGSAKLSEMKLSEFKRWLRTVRIIELDGERRAFEYNDSQIQSIRQYAQSKEAQPIETPIREHPDAEIELGLIRVPFSTDLCIIRIDEDLKSATVRYDDEPPVKAEIETKE